MKLTIIGVKELDAQLQLIAESDGPKGVNGMMRKTIRAAVTTIVKPEVLARVPVAEAAYSRPSSTRVEGREEGAIVGTKASIQSEPGFLLSKITVRAQRRSRKSIGYWVGFPDTLFQGDTYYAGFLEYGTKNRRHKSGKSTGMIKADSFLRVPLYSNAQQVIEFCRGKVRVYINERNSVA